MTVVATIWLDHLDRADWRATRSRLCSWQVRGLAYLELADRPVDLATIATAASIDDLPRPDCCPKHARARPRVVVFDPGLAGALLRLVGNRPPPDDLPPIGSEP